MVFPDNITWEEESLGSPTKAPRGAQKVEKEFSRGQAEGQWAGMFLVQDWERLNGAQKEGMN